MFGEMIKSFAKVKQTEEYELTTHDLELQDIWNSLDPELKDFAKATRSLGLGHNGNVRFSQLPKN